MCVRFHLTHDAILFLAVLQAVQLLLCDWLLTTRTELWEMSQPGDKGDKPATQMELIAFQQDLSSLRKLSQVNKAALPKVSSVIVILSLIHI